jgi:hypothetical protein
MQTLARNFVTPYYTQNLSNEEKYDRKCRAEPPYGLAPQIFKIFSIIGTFKIFFKYYMPKIRVSPPKNKY